MEPSRRGALALPAAMMADGGGAARAQQAASPAIRIGVLSDMSGPCRDTSGPNRVVMARQAVQDFGAAWGLTVEILQADHQHKPDVGVNVARQWFGRDGADAVLGINNSAIVMAINRPARKENNSQVVASAVHPFRRPPTSRPSPSAPRRRGRTRLASATPARTR